MLSVAELERRLVFWRFATLAAVAFALAPGVRWTDPAQDEACIGWIRETFAPLRVDGQAVRLQSRDFR